MFNQSCLNQWAKNSSCQNIIFKKPLKKNPSVTINYPVSLHLSNNITNNDLITRID